MMILQVPYKEILGVRFHPANLKNRYGYGFLVPALLTSLV